MHQALIRRAALLVVVPAVAGLLGAAVVLASEPACWRELAADRSNLYCTAIIKLRTNPWP